MTFEKKLLIGIVILLVALVMSMLGLVHSLAGAANQLQRYEHACASACPTSNSEYRVMSNTCYCNGKRVEAAR